MLDAIYMQVLDMSKTASVVILVVLFARLLLKKTPKVFSYALWAVVLFRLLCPFSFEASVSVVPKMTSVSQGYTLSEEPISVFGASEAAYQAVGDALNGGLGIQHIRTTEKDETGMTKYVTTDWWSVWILFGQYVWVAGIAAMLVYSAASYGKLRKKLLVVVPVRDNIFIADDIKSPFVVGLLRPKIYLPCNLGEKEQEYIILHEQHHIKRLDHIVKALAFLALTVHWFNPLVWLAFVLAGKDMEMSCDEAVIRKIGSDVRADYSASLLTLATGRRIIAGTPLAFGEGDTKGRINNLAKWKKPAVFAVVLAAIACVLLAVGLLTTPAEEREFPINGSNVSELDTEQIIEKIAKVEKLEYPSNLFATVDNFDLMFTSDFNWANDGAIRFFYMKHQKTYSAQLRMFHDDNKYFITDSSEWVEQDIIIRLFDYLNALKYMPQEEIRRLSPNADGYSVLIRHEGTPGDYERVLKYSESGIDDSDGWYIHLEVQPLHENDGGGYFGSGNEVIHLFYGGSSTQAFTGEPIPGTTYVPYECLYMNPLSSYAAMGGDSGCKYVVGEDYFATIYRGNSISINPTNPALDTASGLQKMIDVPRWKWQEFPYTDEEWASLYRPKGMWSIENISEQYSEMLYQPLTSGKFLLKMDTSLWLVEISNDPKVGTYIWSIYSLVPESAMGSAQWEYAPMLSSRIPVFPFDFDLEHTEIIAYCSNGSLGTYGVDSGSSLTIKNGETLYWSPIGEDGTAVSSAIIRFSVSQGETPAYNGTIYIEGSTGSDGRTTYTATIIGTGLPSSFKATMSLTDRL